MATHLPDEKIADFLEQHYQPRGYAVVLGGDPGQTHHVEQGEQERLHLAELSLLYGLQMASERHQVQVNVPGFSQSCEKAELVNPTQLWCVRFWPESKPSQQAQHILRYPCTEKFLDHCSSEAIIRKGDKLTARQGTRQKSQVYSTHLGPGHLKQENHWEKLTQHCKAKLSNSKLS